MQLPCHCAVLHPILSCFTGLFLVLICFPLFGTIYRSISVSVSVYRFVCLSIHRYMCLLICCCPSTSSISSSLVPVSACCLFGCLSILHYPILSLQIEFDLSILTYCCMFVCMCKSMQDMFLFVIEYPVYYLCCVLHVDSAKENRWIDKQIDECTDRCPQMCV